MTTNKIIGYILLSVGLLMVVFTLYSSYQIFTGEKSAPQIFYSYDTKSLGKTGGTSVQDQLQGAVNDQLGKILPSGSISQMLNLTSWSALAFLLMYGGGKISSIGIKLLKEEKDEESE